VKPKGSWVAGRAKSATVIAVAIVALLSLGTAVAGKLITGRDVKNNSIPGKKIRKHTITGRQIKKHSIPLSALKKAPKGARGPKGEKGDPGSPGAAGAPGLAGAEGPIGPSAFTEVISIGGEIAIVPDGEEPVFLGEPAEAVFFEGDRGTVTATATVGNATEAIDNPTGFRLGICYEIEGEGVEPFYDSEADEEAGVFGVSPKLPAATRVAVTTSSGFYVSGEFEGGFEAAMGPCVLNDTGSELDENDRVSGVLMVAEG
jgi:hypothetical protein